jgi:hypothetical protein
VPTVLGARWRTQTLRRILTSPGTAGLREHNGTIRPAQWDAILDDDVRLRLAAVLDGPKRGRVARVALLAGGLAICGRCGTALQTGSKGTRGNGRRIYRCPPGYGCGRLQIVAQPVEDAVTEAVLAYVDRPELAAALATAEADAGTDDLADIEARLGELADLYAERTISKDEWMRARSGLEARRQEATAALRARQPADALAAYREAGVLRRTWPDLTLDQRRAVVAACIEHVTVAPAAVSGPQFDPDRLTISWRS